MQINTSILKLADRIKNHFELLANPDKNIKDWQYINTASITLDMCASFEDMVVDKLVNKSEGE
jgi:hypothetical protein